LRTHAEQREPIDIAKYFEFTTSDIISDFCFAESYGQLRSGEQEQTIKAMHKFTPLQVKLSVFPRVLQLFAILRYLGIAQMNVLAKAREQVNRRIEKATEEPDVMKHVMGHISEDGDGMSIDELGPNAMVLMLAGSETTATSLAGAMFYLLKSQTVLHKLTEEVRDSFQSSDDITMAKV
jgi:cytochrome P450